MNTGQERINEFVIREKLEAIGYEIRMDKEEAL